MARSNALARQLLWLFIVASLLIQSSRGQMPLHALKGTAARILAGDSKIILASSHYKTGTTLAGCIFGSLAELTQLPYAHIGPAPNVKNLHAELDRALESNNRRLPLLATSGQKPEEKCFKMQATSRAACRHECPCDRRPNDCLIIKPKGYCTISALQESVRVVHFIRNPFDMVIAGYLYNSHKPAKAQWVKEVFVKRYGEWLVDIGIPHDSLQQLGVFDATDKTSLWDHFQSLAPERGILLEFLRAAYTIYGMARQFILNEESPKFLHVRYEEMEVDYDAAIDRILSYTGLPGILPEESAKDVVRRCNVFHGGVLHGNLASNVPITPEEKKEFSEHLMAVPPARIALCNLTHSLGYLDRRCGDAEDGYKFTKLHKASRSTPTGGAPQQPGKPTGTADDFLAEVLGNEAENVGNNDIPSAPVDQQPQQAAAVDQVNSAGEQQAAPKGWRPIGEASDQPASEEKVQQQEQEQSTRSKPESGGWQRLGGDTPTASKEESFQSTKSQRAADSESSAVRESNTKSKRPRPKSELGDTFQLVGLGEDANDDDDFSQHGPGKLGLDEKPIFVSAKKKEDTDETESSATGKQGDKTGASEKQENEEEGRMFKPKRAEADAEEAAEKPAAKQLQEEVEVVEKSGAGKEEEEELVSTFEGKRQETGVQDKQGNEAQEDFSKKTKSWETTSLKEKQDDEPQGDFSKKTRSWDAAPVKESVDNDHSTRLQLDEEDEQAEKEQEREGRQKGGKGKKKVDEETEETEEHTAIKGRDKWSSTLAKALEQ